MKCEKQRAGDCCLRQFKAVKLFLNTSFYAQIEDLDKKTYLFAMSVNELYDYLQFIIVAT